MKQTRDQLEYAISQYIDGTLPPLESAALEERFAVDAEAREVLAEYRTLDETLKTSLPLPAVAWDRLHAHLSDAVSREEAPMRHSALRSHVRYAAVALAACVAVVFGVVFLSSDRSGPGAPAPTPQPIAIVVGPQVEQASRQVASVAEVTIGPAPTISDSWRYAETVVSRPAVVMIDRAARPAQDGELSPF